MPSITSVSCCFADRSASSAFCWKSRISLFGFGLLRFSPCIGFGVMRPPVGNSAAQKANSVPWKAAAALRYALRGVAMVFEERNILVLAVATALAASAGVLFRLSAMEWCAVLFAIALGWVAEALNTALERLTDLASPEFHPLAGKAQDMAAGAVLLAVAGAVSVGIVIFGPRLF